MVCASPILSSASQTCCLVTFTAPPPAHLIAGALARALARVFRRWLKAARIKENSFYSSSPFTGGSSNRVSRITALPTFGLGIKQDADTFSTVSGFA